MDILTTWAVTNPAVARLLWVLVLVLATFLVWLFFFCCYSWNQSSSPSLERYLAVMAKHSKSKAPAQRKKKPKEKPVASVQSEEVVAKETAALEQPPPCPSVRKRKRRPLKAGMETVTAVRTQKTMEEVKEKPKRRPLVRAASEESSSDLSSVSYSPSLGDTLPWNLPKHHRIKRSKSASGDVLDPAERAVIRIAGKSLFLLPGFKRGKHLVGLACGSKVTVSDTKP